MRLRGSIPTWAWCVCVLSLLAATATPLFADQQFRWQEYSPSELHKQLWQGKAKADVDHRAAAETAGADAISQSNYDVQFYDVAISVDDTAEIIYGRVLIDALVTEDNVTQVNVDLYNNMTIDSIVSAGGTLTYGRASNVVFTFLNQTYNTGDTLQLTFHYHGHPVEGGFQAFSFGSYSGNPVISTLSEPYFAQTWWPCKDRMDDKPDSMDMAIEVENTFYVGSNGTLDSVVLATPTRDTYYYSVRYPIATYLFSLAISNYSVWTQDYVYNGGADTMPVVHAVFPSLDSYSRPRFGITPDAISILSDKYGPYPFLSEKYGHSNFTWGGGMEHQTMTSMGGTSFAFSEPVVVHELGHQWWGDMITCASWHDIWLNEGWASYSEALYYEEVEGTASYRSYMANMEHTAGGTIYVSDTTNVGSIFDIIVYDKGAWVCHMLRGILGDSLFFAGVDAYYNSEFQYKAATSLDFENVFEQATGEELSYFFEDWLHGEYRPSYHRFLWSEPSPGGGYDDYLVIRQVQTSNPQVFRMPMDLERQFVGGGKDTVRVFNDEREQLFVFNTPDEMSDYIIDPNYWILKYTGSLRAWEMFVVSPDGPLSNASENYAYSDSVKVRGGSGSNTVSISAGSLPPGLSIDNDGVISGVPTQVGTYYFTVFFDDNSTSYTAEGDFSIEVEEAPLVPGEVTGDGIVDLSDLLYIAEAIFLGGDPIPIPAAADVNADCLLDLGDVLHMAGALFLGGPGMQIGCAE